MNEQGRLYGLPPNLHIGTCSWKYDDWKGLIYDPAKTYSPNDYLPDYAKHFSTVEIDRWFLSLLPAEIKLPDPETAKIYADSVPDDFIFSVKVPNAITLTHHFPRQPAKHKEVANKPNEHFLNVDVLERFLEILQPFGNKLGPVIFQFGYLTKATMPSLKVLLDRFSEFFDQVPKGFHYAVQVGNPNYLKQSFFKFLRERDLSPVLVERYGMPPIAQVAEKFDISTAKSTVIRLMGVDRWKVKMQAGKTWDKIVAPKDESIEGVAKVVREQVDKGREVFVNVNNHYEGCAVLTIGKLVERLG